MYLLSALLLFLLYVQIIVMYRRKKRGWSYNASYTIRVAQLINVLEVLENSSIGGYLYLSSSKFPFRIYLLKNQNNTEWWFELYIKNTSQKVIDNLEKTFPFNVAPSIYLPVTLNKSFQKFNRYIIGSEKEELAIFLRELFTNYLNCDKDSKIYLRFINIEVEKGLYLS
jgi:hypothetical protein